MSHVAAAPAASIDVSSFVVPPPTVSSGGGEQRALLPQRGALAFARNLPLRDAVAAAFAAEIAHAIALHRFSLTHPVRAVHGFRKSVRRARALVRLLRPALPDPTRLALEHTLRDATRGTTDLRNSEILPAAMQALDGLKRRPFAALRAELAARQAAMRHSGEIAPALHDGAAALPGLVPVFAAALDANLTWEVLGASLSVTYRRARQSLRKATKHPNNQLIHDCRKCARDLRDQLAYVLQDDAHGAARHDEMANLVKDLGAVTDLIALREWSRTYGAEVDERGTRVLTWTIKARMTSEFGTLAEQGQKLFQRKPKHYAAAILAAAD